MSESPAVSVLMPVYNAERYVGEAVESILNQTFTDFEFIIIDDGSTDSSLNILRKYEARDARIHLISRPNTGYVIALNEGLAACRAPYIARMDADDVAFPMRLAKQVDYLIENPECVCIGCGHELIDEKGRRLLPVKGSATEDAAIQEALMRGLNIICHPTVVMRKDAVCNVGGYDETMLAMEDYDLWLRMGESGQLALLADILLRYRVHDGSVSSLNSRVQYDGMKRAHQNACRRRGVEALFEPKSTNRPDGSGEERHAFTIKLGWWAWKSGEWKTAVIYALKAMRLRPFAPRHWRLLYCALVKRGPRAGMGEKP